ncbi:MAG: glycosyltransferase [candidate division Zixibacteria bacterium]|nr:glycosyltransferase [candidate division Zixibacteria bacterium]
MNVLFLTGDIPYPTNTGARLRTFNLIKHASTDEDVHITLATMVHDENYSARLAEMRRHCAGVEYVSHPPGSRAGFYGGIFKNLFSSRPFIVDKHVFRPYVDMVAELASTGKFDLIHCDSISLATSVPDQSGLPLVLTEHNMEAVIWQRYHEEEKHPLKRFYIGLQYDKVRSFEEGLCRLFDMVIAVSEEDKGRLAESYNARNVVVVPNGVQTDFFTPSSLAIEPETLVFTGSMDWRPNQDAIVWFHEDIWPRILEQRPRTRLWIVGRKPPEKIIALAKADNRITVTGTVDDVRGYIAKAAVYIVPLRIGGGSRLKILEALSMKKAVVSTTIGAEGLDVTAGRDIIIADSPESFAKEIFALFDNPATCERLGENGRAMVLEKYDWDRVAKLQVQVWRAACEVKPKPKGTTLRTGRIHG